MGRSWFARGGGKLLGRSHWVVGLIGALVLVPLSAGAGIVGVAGPAGADTATYSSTQVGTTGDTPTFAQAGPWTMSWSYSCAPGVSQPGFFVLVNQPATSVLFDLGPTELGTSGRGTDYYYDSGTFNLSVLSLCDWSITVNATSAATTGVPVTITSNQIGHSGTAQAFSVGGPWKLTWSYDCSNIGSQGTLDVLANQPSSGLSLTIGLSETGSGGSGTASYTDTGSFSLLVLSDCNWSITVSSDVPTPPPSSSPTVPASQFPRPITGMASTPDGGGYWIADAQGDVEAFGNAANYGSMAGTILNAPISHIVSTPDGKGYWLVASDGGTFSFGNAQFYGSMGGRRLNAPVVDIAPTQDGGGYWLVASDGGIFAFGDAAFRGSMGGQHLNKPVVGISPDNATGGYWEVATDGGIFAFGAPFFGSTGSMHLNRPVNGMTATPDGQGYWFVASDGGIFTGGDAQFHGSTGALRLNAPVVGMATDNASGGYWLVASDGGIFTFNSPFYGAA